MLNWIIDFSLKNRFIVLLAAFAMAAFGVYSMMQLDIDAFPDTTPVQVQINTVAPSLAPEEVEQQITFPIEQVLSGLPRLEGLRSISKFGLSQVVVTFADGTDIYFARTVINERLTTVDLPVGVARSKMGPVSTGLGEIFHYIVTGKGTDVTDLRTIHDWVIKPKMKTVKGAAEINSWGGFEKQYQIRIDTDKLVKHGLAFDEVINAVERNNKNVGGGSLSQTSGMLLVHGLGRTVTIEEIQNIVVTARDGVSIKVGDIAQVTIGHEIRRGAVTANGQGEVVMGLGFLLMGENSHKVTKEMKEKLRELKLSLPPNVKVTTVYDRTELIEVVIDTVRNNLFEGGLFVIAILFLFLGNLRAAFIVALAIPLSMLFAFSGMLRFGISASLLSLGAIDFGMVVDSSVVMIENCVRHIAHGDAKNRSKIEVIRDAAVEVRRPTMFGELIIMIVYLPILTLEGIEGKFFRPMALTVIFALVGSMILSLTLMPVLASFFLPKKIEEREPLIMRIALALYKPVLAFSMKHKLIVLTVAGSLLFFAFGIVAPNLGSEFVPKLSEGSIAIGVVRLAGTNLEDSIAANTQLEKLILSEFPDEVRHVWSRVGSAEVATDPMGVELTDIFITLWPREKWKKAKTQADFTDLLQKKLRIIPGQKLAYSQPIELRFNEMISGVRSDVGVKLYGDDFKVLVKKAQEIVKTLNTIDGSADINTEQITGQPVLQVKVRREELARYGIPAQTILDLIESLGSKPLGEIVEGQYRFPLVVRLPDFHRTSPDSIGSILITASSGESIPLSQLATIEIIEGPSTISREWGQRRITVTVNVRRRDLGSYVEEAQRKIREEVTMPSSRYHVEFGGQYEHLISAKNRLLIVVPLALLLIFMLLYFTYHSVIDALRVFTGVPFAWVGGIIALWLRDMPFSVSAAVGFVALSGVAVLDDMILVSYIRQLLQKGLGLEEAVQEAALVRLRPVLMTSLVASLGFLPMAFSTGVGAEVQRPLATVVIGGVISAMVMSLYVLRVLYMVFSFGGRKQAEPSASTQ